ncbi:hypothetical protein BGZ60DRAFT_417315 [Tricladium varicosporioides]|nr:hypothetical protein BGZ60DRAFT_417315 [Hymenoscyphus varicosporioides]
MLNQYRYIFVLFIFCIFIFISYHLRRTGIHEVPIPLPPPKSKYKPIKPFAPPPILENFPLAAIAHSAADLPPVPSFNAPPSPHILEKTPLFIGFTRNWRVLQQAVVSYITSGWPPEDIYVVENTGVMDSNKRGLLSLQNPFFLNHTRLSLLGVNVLVTPTLLTFAQLQNFYIFTSIEKEWPHYFWSHMDIVSVSYEDRYRETHNYSDFKSVYKNCVKSLRNVTAAGAPHWAMRFFSYDRLALVNVASFVEVGGWDTLIPFYMTDCDMHARLEMAGYVTKEDSVGMIYDMGSSVDDLLVFYRKTGDGIPAPSWTDPEKIEEEQISKAIAEGLLPTPAPVIGPKRRGEDRSLKARYDTNSVADISPAGLRSVRTWQDDTPASDTHFRPLIDTLNAMTDAKGRSAKGRNTWQARAAGGKGEPFYRDSAGFEIGIQMTIEHGRRVFAEKWGHRDCNIKDVGLKADDAWIVEHDWEDPPLPSCKP